ncbi:MAG: hypothetical protein K2Q22_17685 [Cytophagales bacterium]|nr:hypothetical protein [Cytophagales bacterium]
MVSCTNTYRVSSTFSSVEPVPIVRPQTNKVNVFYLGEPIRFKYEKIGFVEARVGSSVDQSHTISHLQYQASKNGADAIISAEKLENVQRNSYYSNSTGLYRSYATSYPYMRGLAVKMDYSSLDTLTDINMMKPDTSFKDVVRADAEVENSVDRSNRWVALIFFSLIIIVIIIIGVNKSK